MSKRNEHLFRFSAKKIAEAAAAEAEYHEARIKYWQSEMDAAYKLVEQTMGAKIEKKEITGGWRAEVTVDYGNPAAYHRLNEAMNKVISHKKSVEQYRSAENLYDTQGSRDYELDADDVLVFRLGGQPREE